MYIIQEIEKLLEGRGFLASFLVISGWSYVIILTVVLICQVFLYLMGQKYENREFMKDTKVINKKKE